MQTYQTKKRKPNAPPLMLPRASVQSAVSAVITAANQPVESWYSMRAMARGSVEILMYDEIGAWGITAKQFAQDLVACGDVSQIILRIHSPGGDVFAGMAIYNTLKAHPARVDVYIDGLAASMASVIAMAGDKVYMPPNAMMMIHKPWGAQGGDADDMRRYADLLDKVETALVQAYVSKTGKSAEEIHALLKDETWMDGSEAVAAGFADQLIAPLVAAAQLKSKRMQEFEHMPPEAFSALMNPRNQVPAPAPAVLPAPAPAATLTADQIRAQVIAEEGARRTGITAAFGSFAGPHAELLQACVADMTCTVEGARAQLLAKLGENTTATSVPGMHGHISNGNLVGDSVRASWKRVSVSRLSKPAMA